MMAFPVNLEPSGLMYPTPVVLNPNETFTYRCGAPLCLHNKQSCHLKLAQLEERGTAEVVLEPDCVRCLSEVMFCNCMVAVGGSCLQSACCTPCMTPPPSSPLLLAVAIPQVACP
jgi:hypothetical protein